MMKNKILEYFKNQSIRQKQILERQKTIIENQNELKLIGLENNWSNIFHDSINEYDSLKNLSLNIGRWAGNYSFFYILFRVLKDFKPNNILDIGLGESSKFISTFISNYHQSAKHTIAEHDEEWITFFKKNFQLSENSSIQKLNLTKKTVHDFEVTSYQNFEKTFTDFYDLIIIDAPFGSERYSRHDIISYIETTEFNNDFVIILDDTDRIGEQDTLKDLVECLNKHRDDIYYKTYKRMKSSTIITNKKFLVSI